MTGKHTPGPWKSVGVTCRCRRCGELVNLDEEGVTYGNGECAHDACDDREQWDRANGQDFED